MTQTQNASTLRNAVDFDCPFAVGDDGSIERAQGIHAPEWPIGDDISSRGAHLYYHPHPSDSAWELVSGFSRQDGYTGPVMHNSEYLGGYMAEWVLENPGVYCLQPVMWLTDDEGINEIEDYVDGWVLARLIETGEETPA